MNYWKKLRLLPLLGLVIFAAGCRHSGPGPLKVGATPGPAEEVLDAIKPQLQQAGLQIEVVHFTDYIQPNMALGSHDIDANLYQNVPFMKQFNKDHGTDFVSVANVYLPLMALYPGRTKTLDALADGAKISVPNDPVNLARGLNLLQSAGLIKLKTLSEGNATQADILENPKHFKIVELDAAQLPRSLGDVDAAAINANFALSAGLHPKHNTLFTETQDSQFTNVLVANKANANDPRIQKLGQILQSAQTASFVSTQYKGAILPLSR